MNKKRDDFFLAGPSRKGGVFLTLLCVFIGNGHSAFEPLGYGAAARGMADAYTAKAEGDAAAYWNPASLALMEAPRAQAALQDVNGLGILRYGVAGYARPGVGGGGVGLVFLRLETIGEASFLDYSENTYLFSYGRLLSPNIAVGTGLRYHAVFSEDRASALGFDAGVLLRSTGDRVRLGAAAQNINRPRLRWATQAVDVLPSAGRVGLLVRLGAATDVSLEQTWRYRDAQSLRAGIERSFISGRFLLRGGAHQTDGRDEWGYAFGGGLRLGSMTVDYAWTHDEELGDTQTFGVSFKFRP